MPEAKDVWCPQHGYPLPCEKCGLGEKEVKMEAKDTVINNKDIMDLEIPCETCDKKPAWGFTTSECMECIALKHRESQAEISFKAGFCEAVNNLGVHKLCLDCQMVNYKVGIHEVVDWIKPRIAVNQFGIMQTNIDAIEWLSKLKAWGIEKGE
jgi:hypothetical protein